MAINTVSSTNSTTTHAQQQSSAKPKPNADFSKVMANANSTAAADPAAEVKKASPSTTPLQSGDANKATA